MNITRTLRLHPLAALTAAAFLTVGLLFSPSAQAQPSATGTITGRVLNQNTREYLRNATVAVAGTELSTVAEAGGNYTLRDVPAGPVRLSVKYAGLDTLEVPVVVSAGQTVTQDVSLTSGDYGAALKLGEFVVATEREGNAKVIMEQKTSIEAKRVIASDTFGTISEGNVGEFLKYLPGIMVDYTEADARSVSLGGLDPKYTAVTIDGSPVASSGLAAASGTGANRAFEFEQISINSIESVEVSRTPQPENPGSALAGIVNLRSRGAFDRAGRFIGVRGGFAYNSMSGNPFQKQPGWDDESHHRLQPNWGIDYSDTFLGNRLGLVAGYNYSYTFSEQKAEVVNYSFDNDRTNNATEVPRVSSFTFRDSPKPTIRYNANARIDFKFSPSFWMSARAEYNRYHAKFFSRDLNFNFTRGTTGSNAAQRWFNDTVNAPDPDGTAVFPAGPVVAGVPFSLSSQTVLNNIGGVNSAGVPVADNIGGGGVSINQGGGATNKYGSTANFGLEGHFQRGDFRLDVGGSMSRSMTWYKDQQFGFFWSIEPNTLNNLGLRFDRNGPADPAVYITQTAGPNYRNLANHPNGFAARMNDRQGEDQRYLLKADAQYSKRMFRIPTVFKFGAHISEWVNNADRPVNSYAVAFRGKDGLANSADEALPLFAEKDYRMNFDFGGNVDGLPNVDRWAAYKIFQQNPSAWTPPSEAQIIGYKLQNARDAQEQIDALYQQTVLKFGSLTVAPGVRFERTRGRASGPTDLGQRETDRRIIGSSAPTAPVASGGLGLTQGEVDLARQSATYLQTRYGGGRSIARQKYDTWLRYLHTTYNITEDLVLKASWNQAISRPDMNRLIGGLVITNDDPANAGLNMATAGNPDLVPEISKTTNLTLEYYTKRVGLLSVSAYRRDFDNLIRNASFFIPAGGSYQGEQLPSTVSTEDWQINTVDNIAKSHMSSIEFAIMRELTFLPGPLSRIRVNANYTRVRYDNYDFYFRPTNIANLSWTIPYRDFTLQWNTNWRPGYRTEVATASNSWANYNRESLTHTMDFQWRFRRNADFFINARNIFNQDGGTYRGQSDLRTRWVETGAIWGTGVRMTF